MSSAFALLLLLLHALTLTKYASTSYQHPSLAAQFCMKHIQPHGKATMV